MGQYFINMLGPWGWAALACVPPAIVALYFLKLRRKPLEVPSTYLWRKSLEDLHVNSLWQRLRKSILLLLQLLLVALIMIAVLRPGWRGTTLTGERFIFLVDNSASMSAGDVRPTRLDEAKRRTEALIDQMGSGSRAMLVSFSDRAQVVQEFTDNRRLLRDRLRQIQPTQRTTDLKEALQLAAGLANADPRATGDEGDAADSMPADMYIFSDGKFPDVADFSLGNLTPIFVPLGEAAAENVAVTAFSTRPDEVDGTRWQAFAQVANYGPRDVTRTAELYAGDELLDAKQIDIAAGGATGLAFDLGQMQRGALRVVLQEKDSLALDDTAYAAVNPPRLARVLLVSPGNEALRLGLLTSQAREHAQVEFAKPAHLASEAYKQQAASGVYDLVVYDQCRPEAMPEANTLFIGRLPPMLEWQTNAEDGMPPTISGPQVIDTNRAHPILQLVELDDILVAESLSLSPPTGGTVLIDGDRGKLMAIAPRGGYEDAVLGFEIVSTAEDGQRFNTNWPIGRLSFPTFLLNVIEYLGRPSGGTSLQSVRPGEPVTLSADGPAAELTVRSPEGDSQRLVRSQQGTYHFHGTEVAGIYQISQEGGQQRHFAVNLFDETESNIRPRPEEAIQIGYVTVDGRTGWEPARRELWKYVLLGALFVLLVEWYIYNRRVFI